jgi:pimeloyl-ACP methyl ester carboxylesterase
MPTVEHRVPNGAGWELCIFQTWDPARLVRGRSPVLIVPGFGMNSFIFSYHPRGASLEAFLAEQGFEVWRADLRAQGSSKWLAGPDRRAKRPPDDYRLEDLAVVDLGAAIETARARSRTGGSRVSVIGASLGGTLLFLHAALVPTHHVGAMVSIGTPVRWVRVHPILDLPLGAPSLLSLIQPRNVRGLAAAVLPHLARHTPWILSSYMNTSITDISAAGEMVRTIEDPNRYLTREIAQWVRRRDLVVRGVNLSEALRGITQPLLCVIAKNDGVVPFETGVFPFHQVGSTAKNLLEVGSATLAMAHADMFISNEAHERVFRPVAGWLAKKTQDLR